MAAPEKLLIPHVDDEFARFRYVGRSEDGNPFMAFVTGAHPADWWSGSRSAEYLRTRWREHKRWYAVLHRFDPDGNHLGTHAWSGGTTIDGQDEAILRARRRRDEFLATLEPLFFCDIEVKLFATEIDGYLFGLIYKCEDADDEEDPQACIEYVMLEPNDIMFHPPWDSGSYST